MSISGEDMAVFLQELINSRPTEMFKRIDDHHAGAGSVLNLLAESEEPIPAGAISDSMNISTARVAVLLRKLADRDWILRENDPDDARRTMVSLSDSGRVQVSRSRDELSVYMEKIIERVGAERMAEFVAISRDIKAAVTEILSESEDNRIHDECDM